jgi:pimeloyl-ACP methyl ester carboxylesterase
MSHAHPFRGGAGRPVFLYLHGFASSPASTKAQAFAGWAADRGLPLEVLDLRVPSFERLLLSAMIERVSAAIDAAGGAAARVALIGSSLGGLAALRVAEAEPRVCALFAMAPALGIVPRWKARLGEDAWEAWRTTGFLEVDDHATHRKARVHWGFVDELIRFDAERGSAPDVRVPVAIVHGTADDVVDIASSRGWAKERAHVRLREVEDSHELGGSIPTILAEADRFFAAFLGPSRASP